MLQFKGSQRIGHNLETEQQISEENKQHCKSIKVKPELHFCTQTDDDISLQPGVLSGNPQNCNLKSYLWSGRTAWDLFPTGTPNHCDSGLPITLFNSGCWSTHFGDVCAVPLLYGFCFPFLFMTIY